MLWRLPVGLLLEEALVREVARCILTFKLRMMQYLYNCGRVFTANVLKVGALPQHVKRVSILLVELVL